MTNIQEIEQAIAQLPREDFVELLRRLRVRQASEEDREFEEEADNRRVDRLWKKAEKKIEADSLRSWDEILDDPGPS